MKEGLRVGVKGEWRGLDLGLREGNRRNERVGSREEECFGVKNGGDRKWVAEVMMVVMVAGERGRKVLKSLD